MQLTMNIPDFTQLTLNVNSDEIIQTIKLNSALMLFKNAKFSITQASEFANISLYDFIQKCKNNQISIIDYSKQELQDEINLMRDL